MPAFRTLESKSVRWRPAEGNGLEHLTARFENGHIIARSVVIGERNDSPYGVRYTIVCDASWAVRQLDLETTSGQTLRLTSDGNGKWSDDAGHELSAFNGCIDLDLAGTPFTNTLPIRRLDLDIDDGAVELAMLYVPFDTFSPIVDEQRYRCLERGRRFRFEAVDGSFTADLLVDEDGFVVDYPALFQRV